MRNVFQKRVLLVLLLAFSTGCATLPGALNIPSYEEKQVAESLNAALKRQQKCGSSLDANVTLSFNSFLRSGSVSGYFQVKSPSYLKFVGENPFGQPIIVFTTDGTKFSYATVLEQLVYNGDVTSRSYKKYAPTGFSPELGFYWFSGKILPTQSRVRYIGRQEDGDHYWIKLSGDQENIFSLVLFDNEKQVVRRHMLVDNKNKALLDVRYSGYSKPLNVAGESICMMPADIIVKSRSHRASLELHFTDWLEHSDFPDTDFELLAPSTFQKIEVQ